MCWVWSGGGLAPAVNGIGKTEVLRRGGENRLFISLFTKAIADAGILSKSHTHTHTRVLEELGGSDICGRET